MSFNIGPTSPANRPVQADPVPTDPAPAGRTSATKPGSPLTESWKATFAQSKPLFALRVLFNLTIVGAAIDAVATTVGHKLGNLGQNAAPVAPTRQASSNAEVLARDRAAARARLATAGTPSQRAGGAELSAPKVARHAEAIAAMPDITRAALSVFRELPDAPPGTIMTQTNPIRSNTLSGTTRDQVVDQTLANGAGSLPFAQAINVPSNVWAGESVLPPNLVAEMARLESLPHSLGAMTFNNTMGTRDVRDNTPAQRFEAALQLREFIQTKLNPEQRAALKDRIDFLAELPPLMLQKFGAPSHLELGKPDQALAVWMKSLGVTGYSYLGLAVTNLEEVMGQPRTQSAILINDALVAMVLHRDVVFAASDPAALSSGIATAEKSLAILQTRLANVGDFEALNTPAHFDALRTEVTKQVRDLSGASPERPQGTLGLHDVITRYASVCQKAAEGDAAASRELPQLRRTLEQAGYSTVGATGQGRSFDAAFKKLHLSITALVQNTPLQEARTEARTLGRKIEEQETHLAALKEKHAASVGDAEMYSGLTPRNVGTAETSLLESTRQRLDDKLSDQGQVRIAADGNEVTLSPEENTLSAAIDRELIRRTMPEFIRALPEPAAIGVALNPEMEWEEVRVFGIEANGDCGFNAMTQALRQIDGPQSPGISRASYVAAIRAELGTPAGAEPTGLQWLALQALNTDLGSDHRFEALNGPGGAAILENWAQVAGNAENHWLSDDGLSYLCRKHDIVLEIFRPAASLDEFLPISAEAGGRINQSDVSNPARTAKVVNLVNKSTLYRALNAALSQINEQPQQDPPAEAPRDFTAADFIGLKQVYSLNYRDEASGVLTDRQQSLRSAFLQRRNAHGDERETTFLSQLRDFEIEAIDGKGNHWDVLVATPQSA